MGEVELKTSYWGLTSKQVAAIDTLNLGMTAGTIVVGCAALVTGGTALVAIAAVGGTAQIILTELTVGETEQGLADRDSSYWISQGVNGIGAVLGGASVLKALNGGKLLTLSSIEMDALLNAAPDVIPLATRGLSVSFGVKSVIVYFSNLSANSNHLVVLRHDGTIGQVAIGEYKNQLSSTLNNNKIEWLKTNLPGTSFTTSVRSDPNRYFLEFEIKDGDDWDTLEAIYGPKIRELPEYGTIQLAGSKSFQIEVKGGKLADLYYSGKLRVGDKGFAIIGNGGVLSDLSGFYGEEITAAGLEGLNKAKSAFVNPGQNITIFSVPPNEINSSPTSADLSKKEALDAATSAAFSAKWQYNFQTILGPTNLAFIDAELSDQDFKSNYTLEDNPNGIVWRVNSAGIPHPDDLDRYFEQQRIIESATNQTITELQDSSDLPMDGGQSSN